MRTPAGVECRFFYGDYFRGKNHEECRLIGNVPPPGNWKPELCTTCPVPGILRANACGFLVLEGKVRRNFGIFKKRVAVSAYCEKSNQKVDEPQIGCGLCHPLPPAITKGLK